MDLDAFMGEIRWVSFDFAPRGWVKCEGQMLSIQQNAPLFSLLGTRYGGDGKNTFALPDLRGRAAIGAGQMPGGGNYPLGAAGGQANVTLTGPQMPQHTHAAIVTPGKISAAGTLEARSGVATGKLKNTPAVNYTVSNTNDPVNGGTLNIYAPVAEGTAVQIGNVAVTGDVTGISAAIQPTGGGQPFPIMQPYLPLTAIICMDGIFPVRD